MTEEEKKAIEELEESIEEVLSNKDKREWLKLLLNTWYGGNNNE